MFEERGYFKEYFIDSKSIGTILCEKDREVMGYTGRQTEVLSTDIILSNGKKIKNGTRIVSIVYPLCGKMKRTIGLNKCPIRRTTSDGSDGRW